MSLYAFIAGRYSATYNAVDVGLTNDGYRLRQEVHYEPINESDHYGQSILDLIYRGGDVYLEFLAKVYASVISTSAVSAFWPWGAGLGIMQTFQGAAGTGVGPLPIGRLAYDLNHPTVLSAILGTPARPSAGAGVPGTLTALRTALAPNFRGELLFNSRLRQVPIQLISLPTETTASDIVTTRWFSVAA